MFEWLQFLLWFCFEKDHAKTVPNPTSFKDQNIWDVLAFSNVAAFGFLCFVILGIIADFVTRNGPNARAAEPTANMASPRFWIAVALGVIAAGVVAILASVFNILQINVQSALITGLTWQVVYARLIAQMNSTARALPETGGTAVADRQQPQIDVKG